MIAYFALSSRSIVYQVQGFWAIFCKKPCTFDRCIVLYPLRHNSFKVTEHPLYTVSHKVSLLFVIVLLADRNSIYHVRCDVLLFCTFCQFCSFIV